MDIKQTIKSRYDSNPPMKIPSNLPSNEKTSLKIDTILWIALAAVTLYYTDLIFVLQTDAIMNKVSYLMAILSGGLSIAVAAYLIVWCSYIQGVSSDDWETSYPFMIPIATGCGLLSGVCWNVALWSVYGIKTPFIILILFMGIVMIISVLPSWSFAEKKSSKPSVNNSKWYKVHGKME